MISFKSIHVIDYYITTVQLEYFNAIIKRSLIIYTVWSDRAVVVIIWLLYESIVKKCFCNFLGTLLVVLTSQKLYCKAEALA